MLETQQFIKDIKMRFTKYGIFIVLSWINKYTSFNRKKSLHPAEVCIQIYSHHENSKLYIYSV